MKTSILNSINIGREDSKVFQANGSKVAEFQALKTKLAKPEDHPDILHKASYLVGAFGELIETNVELQDAGNLINATMQEYLGEYLSAVIKDERYGKEVYNIIEEEFKSTFPITFDLLVQVGTEGSQF